MSLRSCPASRSAAQEAGHTGVLYRGDDKDVVSFLTLVLILLTAIPAVLIFHSLGAFGTPANVLAAIGFICWLCARLVPLGLPARGFNPVHVALVLLSVGVLASYANAMSRPMDNTQLRAADRGLLSLVAWSGICLLAADGICCWHRLRVLLQRLVLAATAIATVGILQFTAGFDLARYLHVPGLVANGDAVFFQARSGFNRVAGTASHPIEYGMVLACVLPLAFHFAIWDKDRPRLVRWIPVVVIAAGLLMSISRSAVIGVVVAAAVLAPTWPQRYRRRILLTVPVFVVAMRLLVPGLIGTTVNLFRFFSQDSSTQARTEDYGKVSKLIVESPFLGIGFRAYLPVIYHRVLDNQFLGTLVETGLLGLATMVLFLAISVLTPRGARRASVDPVHRDLAQSVTAAIVAAALSFSTFDALAFPMFAAILFLLVGCGGALWRLARQPPLIGARHTSRADCGAL